MSSPIEEGELPEEGEIMEDEEEETIDETIKEKIPTPVEFPIIESTAKITSSEAPDVAAYVSKKTFVPVCVGTATPPSSRTKYRDYDGKSTRHADRVHDESLNSWTSGLARRTRPTSPLATMRGDSKRAQRRTDEDDADDRDFRRLALNAGSTVSSTTVSRHHHHRGDEPHSTKEREKIRDTADRLFGEYTEEENGEDNDFRQPHDSHQNRRRRHSGESREVAQSYSGYTKRSRPTVSNIPSALASTDSFGADSDEMDAMAVETRRSTTNSGRLPQAQWASRTICKFFREGFCRDGDACAFSHNASDSNRRPELCKFYGQGYCKRGMSCTHLHGEYPCKAFHKGECTNEPCVFSHLPLDDFTQSIFDQMVHDEELTSNITLPSQPQRRKVLLPLGPETNDANNNDRSRSGSPLACGATNVSPPGLNTTAPSSSSTSATIGGSERRLLNPTQQQLKQRAAEEAALAAAGAFGFFNPISRITPKAPIPPPTSNQPTLVDPLKVVPPTLASTSTPTLGAFSTPPVVASATSTIGGATSTSSSVTTSRTRLSLHAGSTRDNVHGYYKPPPRVTNIPPPVLLTAPPPPLANNGNSTAVTTSPASTTTAVTSIGTSTPSGSSSIFFNQPTITPSTSSSINGIKMRVTSPPSNTPLSGLFSASPFVSRDDISPALNSSSTRQSIASAKPLAGIFSGSFFDAPPPSQTQSGFTTSSQIAASTATSTTTTTTTTTPAPDAFNISAMLERITQQATAAASTTTATGALPPLGSFIESTSGIASVDKLLNESPASPTNFPADGSSSKVKVIPVIREWKLYKVDFDKEEEDVSVDLKWISQITSGSYKNDPRLKKLAERQFDLVTRTLEKQSTAAVAASAAKKEKDSPTGSVSAADSPAASPPKKPSDPRLKLADPRRRSTSSANSTFYTLLPGTPPSDAPGATTSIGPPKSDPVAFFEPNFHASPNLSASTSHFSSLATKPPMIAGPVGAVLRTGPRQPLSDDIFQSMIQEQLKLVNQLQQNPGLIASVGEANNSDDVDHRSFATPPPSLVRNAPPSSSLLGVSAPSALVCPSFGTHPRGNAFANAIFANFGDEFKHQQHVGNDFLSMHLNNNHVGGRYGGRGIRRDFETPSSRYTKMSEENAQQHCGRWNNNSSQDNKRNNNNNSRRYQNNENDDIDANAVGKEEISQRKTMSPGANSVQQLPTPSQPLSLREKRKNNEYESPLARLTSSKY